MQPARHLVICFAVLALSMASTNSSHAVAVGVTDYRQISGRYFADLRGSNSIPAVQLGAVTITTTPHLVASAFTAFTPGDPDNPGSGDGYRSRSLGVGVPLTHVTVDFSSPVAAFGATFMHSFRDATDQPGSVVAYDGPAGTGNVVGSILSSGWLGTQLSNNDFVGVWSDLANIRSAVVAGTGFGHGFAIDGYGLSITPTPEPTSWLLLATGAASLAICGRHRRRRMRSRGET